jgi:tetratricopeptide (TPR) repeat protein
MITLHDIARTPALLVLKLRKLERQGRYNEALQQCLEVVDGKAGLPSLDSATDIERAELLLRYGALIGFLGHNSQVANSQEQSKDVLTQALAEFSGLADELKIAECENYIALSYWRLGELNEAEVWLESSFDRNCPLRSYPRLHWYVVRSLVNIEARRFAENIDLLNSVKEDLLAFDDAHLSGMFYANLGVSLKDLGCHDDALSCFQLARYFHKRCGHRIYSGTIENNIALLYCDLGRYANAHAAIDDAVKTFKSAKDKTRTGFALDTKANIFLTEGDHANALSTADVSIDILKRGENSGYRVESLLTRSRILLHLNRFADAVLTLFEAVEIQRVKRGETAARELVSAFESEVLGIHSSGAKAQPVGATELSGVELMLPRSLGSYSSYSAVRINNSYLETFGLARGDLAIVVDQKVERGDLVAIEQLNDGSVRCGVFDSDFGLICLDRGDQDPQLFDEADVRVLGKIVGVAQQKDTPGQVVVQPLTGRSSKG